MSLLTFEITRIGELADLRRQLRTAIEHDDVAAAEALRRQMLLSIGAH